jgi:hypothetical protein
VVLCDLDVEDELRHQLLGQVGKGQAEKVHQASAIEEKNVVQITHKGRYESLFLQHFTSELFSHMVLSNKHLKTRSMHYAAYFISCI